MQRILALAFGMGSDQSPSFVKQKQSLPRCLEMLEKMEVPLEQVFSLGGSNALI
jgi:hypothetical protein